MLTADRLIRCRRHHNVATVWISSNDEPAAPFQSVAESQLKPFFVMPGWYFLVVVVVVVVHAQWGCGLPAPAVWWLRPPLQRLNLSPPILFHFHHVFSIVVLLIISIVWIYASDQVFHCWNKSSPMNETRQDGVGSIE
jgi:hypothetical protein